MTTREQALQAPISVKLGELIALNQSHSLIIDALQLLYAAAKDGKPDEVVRLLAHEAGDDLIHGSKSLLATMDEINERELPK